MKLAVLGLGGVGRAIAKTAARRSCFSSILYADIDPGAVDRILAALAGKMRGVSCFGTMVRGERAGQKVASFMYNRLSQEKAHAMLGKLATSVHTGIPAALAAELLATGLIETRGAVPPESLDPQPFIENLPAWGLKIECEDRF